MEKWDKLAVMEQWRKGGWRWDSQHTRDGDNGGGEVLTKEWDLLW